MSSTVVSSVLLPGQEIGEDAGLLRGHGTYLSGSTLCSSVAGTVSRVDKLVTVKPPKQRFSGEVGDLVVGRVTAVEAKRWRVDLGGHKVSLW